MPERAIDCNQAMEDEPVVRIKVVVVGDSQVGKTCLLLSYTTGKFPADSVPTVFDNYKSGESGEALPLFEGCRINLGLWDTFERGDMLRVLSYQHADTILLCFSVVDPKSFEHVTSNWVPEVRHHCPEVPIFLVGTKIDLREDADVLDTLKSAGRDTVSFAQGDGLAQDIHAEGYLECSSLTMRGVATVFAAVMAKAIHSPPVRTKPSGEGRCTVS